MSGAVRFLHKLEVDAEDEVILALDLSSVCPFEGLVSPYTVIHGMSSLYSAISGYLCSSNNVPSSICNIEQACICMANYPCPAGLRWYKLLAIFRNHVLY